MHAVTRTNCYGPPSAVPRLDGQNMVVATGHSVAGRQPGGRTDDYRKANLLLHFKPA
jgi:hypothetical protein